MSRYGGSRRHSVNIMMTGTPSLLSLSPPEGGLLPDAQPEGGGLPWVLSEADIPTFGKLKKIHKKELRRGSVFDLSSAVQAESPVDPGNGRRGKNRRSSMCVPPTSPEPRESNNLAASILKFQAMHNMQKEKKKTRRPSFAGIKNLFLDKSRRRKSNTSLEEGEVGGHKPVRKISSTSSDSSCQESYGSDHEHLTANSALLANSYFLERLKGNQNYGSRGSLRNLSDSPNTLDNLREEQISITDRTSSRSNSSVGYDDDDTIKGYSEDDRLSSQDPLDNHESDYRRRSSAVSCSHHDDSVFNEHVSDSDRSGKVCHHGDCLERNSGLPLILCTVCDGSVHSSPESESHLRFHLSSSNHDVSRDSPPIPIHRRGSSQSLPEGGLLPETTTSDTELETSRDAGDDCVDGEIRNNKLHRKRVVRVRRHPTENEQKALSRMMSATHRRSRSYQEFSTLDLLGASGRDPVATASGPDLRVPSRDVDTTDGPPQNSLSDAKKRVFSVDSLPLKVEMPSRAYLYPEKGTMPVLETPSPGFLSPSQMSPGVFLLPGLEHTAEGTHGNADTPTDASSQSGSTSAPVYQRKRSDSKRRDLISPPHVFTRKHSMPAMLSGVTVSHGDRKVNVGNVECFRIHFDIIQDLIRGQDIEIVPAIKGVILREAVSSYIEKRGLTFDMVDFFIAASQSPLQVDRADCFYLAGADLHVKAKQSGDPAFSRQMYGSTKSTVSTRSVEKRPLHMYLKRDQSVRHNPQSSSCNGSSSGPQTPTGVPPSAHRWSSLRPRGSIPNVVKNEPHPLAHGQSLSLETYTPLDDETKGSRQDLNESGSPHGAARSQQPLKGISKLFGANPKKSDQLQEMLYQYRTNGLPAMPDLLQLGNKKFDPKMFDLESNWTDLVADSQNCDRYQQEAIWELLRTEAAYIKDLQFVINLFLACLYNLQSQALLNDVETEKIFSNIADLHQSNCRFYESHMYKVLTTARETRQPLDPAPLIQGFSQFRTYFDPYSKFCIEYMACQQYLTRMKEENELFRMFLNWAENLPECNRLSLGDYIGKPFQRLTKYKLLLERVWKSERPDNVQELISKVDQFVCQVNATVTQLEIMRRIDSYDAVDLPNNDTLAKMVGPYCRLDLTRPIPGSNRTRFLVEEGTLRMNNRTEVICFLFTDMLLITKSNKKLDVNNKVRVKVYKPPMRLDKIYVNPLHDGGFMLVYLNEYNLATTAYTFHGDHARHWLERIRQTQDEYEKLRNAIMDQSEAYLLNLANGYEQYEDEFAYMNARTVAMEMGLDRVNVNRQVSMTSADVFMGNMADRGGGGEKGRSRLPSDFSGSRGRVVNPGLVHVTDSESPKDSPPATPLVSSSYPSNGATLNARFQSPQEAFHLSSGDNPLRTPDSRHSHRSVVQMFSSPVVPTPSDSPSHSAALHARRAGDEHKGRHGRRTQRYYTADMVQELHHNPAPIQKRLSWHSGAKDSDYEYRQQGMGKLCTVSSDSLRSVHSSSGVSSVGSFQNPDNEISEESDWVMGDVSSEESSQASDTTTKTRISSTTEPGDFPLSQGLDNDDLSPHIVKSSGHHVSFSADNNNIMEESNLSSQTKVSKSMPDISRLSIVSEGEGEESPGRDRSSTIDMVREANLREGQRRKLSDTQTQRLKLQILNSTLEATDV